MEFIQFSSFVQYLLFIFHCHNFWELKFIQWVHTINRILKVDKKSIENYLIFTSINTLIKDYNCNTKQIQMKNDECNHDHLPKQPEKTLGIALLISMLHN